MLHRQHAERDVAGLVLHADALHGSAWYSGLGGNWGMALPSYGQTEAVQPG